MDGPNVKTPHWRPSEDTFTRALLNKNVVATDAKKVEQMTSRRQADTKFGSLGGAINVQVEPGSVARFKEESGDEVELPGEFERRKAKAGSNKVARRWSGASSPNNRRASGTRCNQCTGGWPRRHLTRQVELARNKGEYHDAEEGLFIDWRKESTDVTPNDGETLDHAYPKIPAGKLHRDMAQEDVLEIRGEVRKAKVKAINGVYELGCFKRCIRSRYHNIIGARWFIKWKMIEGIVGVKCDQRCMVLNINVRT